MCCERERGDVCACVFFTSSPLTVTHTHSLPPTLCVSVRVLVYVHAHDDTHSDAGQTHTKWACECH